MTDSLTALDVAGNSSGVATAVGTTVPLFQVLGNGTFILNGNPGLVNLHTMPPGPPPFGGVLVIQFEVLNVSGNGTVKFSPLVPGSPNSLINVQDGSTLEVGYKVLNPLNPVLPGTATPAMAPVVRVTGGALLVGNPSPNGGTLLTVGVTGGGGNTVLVNGGLLNASGGTITVTDQLLNSADTTASLTFKDALVRMSGTAVLTVQGNAGTDAAITVPGTTLASLPGLLIMTGAGTGSPQATFLGSLAFVNAPSGAAALMTTGSVIQLTGGSTAGPTLSMGGRPRRGARRF